MKKVIVAVMCAVMMFCTIAIGYAKEGDLREGIRTRIHEAKERIKQGVERGTLTKGEVQKLHKELDGILHKIDRMKNDGQLSKSEREKINRDLDRLNKDITKEVRDDDTRKRKDDDTRKHKDDDRRR